MSIIDDSGLYADTLRDRLGKVWFRRVRLSESETYALIDLLKNVAAVITRTEQERDQHQQDAARFEQQAEYQDAEIQSLKTERDELRGQVNRLQSALSSVVQEANSVDFMCRNCSEYLKGGLCPNDCPPF